MIHGEITIKNAVSPPSPSSTSQNRLDATRQARLRSPFTSRSLKTGTNAEERADGAEVVARNDLADEPEDARERRREREDRRQPGKPALVDGCGGGGDGLVGGRAHAVSIRRRPVVATISAPAKRALFTLCRT